MWIWIKKLRVKMGKQSYFEMRKDQEMSDLIDYDIKDLKIAHSIKQK